MLLTFGDLIDFYHQIRRKSQSNPLNRMFMRQEERTRTWWSHTGGVPRNWWDVPAVAGRLNEKITGTATVTYGRFIGETYFAAKNSIRLLSIGCGTGHKEIALAKVWPRWNIEAFDASPLRIAAAHLAAREAGAGSITFTASTLSDFRFSPDTFDIILFDSSLHHFSGFDTLFRRIKTALTVRGIVVINEYTGPDRFQWSTLQLQAANSLLRAIPSPYRTRFNSRWEKRRIYRPGYLRMLFSDPSEAITSSCILPSLHAHFSVIREVPLGGNLLHLLLKDIAHHFIQPDDEAEKILSALFEKEDEFLQSSPSDFTFGVYRAD